VQKGGLTKALEPEARLLMTKNAIISAIIVNRNGAHHLRTCLSSLLAQSYMPLEIIVVDNASTDESCAVANEFGVRWLSLDTNLGLAPALNRGAAVARGEFFLFVNNDMRFDKEFVAKLIEPLIHDGEIFATDGMQFNWEGTKISHSATALAKTPSRQGPTLEIVPGLHMNQELTSEISASYMASAASVLTRRSHFEMLGGFDEKLPLGYEDVDICWRAWIRGWKTVFVPMAICWHRVGSSTRTPEGRRLLFRGVLGGRLLIATKLLPLRYALWTWLVSVGGLGRDLILMRWRAAGDRLETLIEYGGYVPGMLREKNSLYESQGITADQQLSFMLHLTTYGEHGSRKHSLEEEDGRNPGRSYSDR
jgi:GT2 family glycosyltransferase